MMLGKRPMAAFVWGGDRKQEQKSADQKEDDTQCAQQTGFKGRTKASTVMLWTLQRGSRILDLHQKDRRASREQVRSVGSSSDLASSKTKRSQLSWLGLM